MTDIFAAAAMIASVFSICAFAVISIRIRSHQREKELILAAYSSNAYLDAVEKFVDDPDMPENLVKLILAFGENSNDREFADFYLKYIMRDGALVRAERKPTASQKELEELSRTRPDLYDHFRTALGMIVASTLLRWPETAQKYPETTLRFLADHNFAVTYLPPAKIDSRGLSLGAPA